MARVQFKQRESTDAIFVHCSATKPNMNWGVREIRQSHKERGFLDVGYHYIIKRDGTVEEGRDEMAVGSHVKGHNHNSIGVCLVGGIRGLATDMVRSPTGMESGSSGKFGST
ncbi:endolysin [Escherichia phage PGX1]|nr:endolysin [Escherichia phage PGX1]